MGIAGAIIGALIAAVGAGVSASASSSAAERSTDKQMAFQEEQERKRREQEKFQFGFDRLAEQRRSAETRARRGFFNKQVIQAMRRGAPRESTF